MSVYDHPLADLDPTEAEIAVLNEVLGELGGYPPGYEPPDDDDPGDGPWHDSPALAYEYGEDADLAEIGGMIDLAHYSEQQRLEEDAEPLPRKAEDRMTHLIDRASRGTYTEHPAFRAAADLANGEPIHGCGPLDEFGRCGSQFHAPTALRRSARPRPPAIMRRPPSGGMRCCRTRGQPSSWPAGPGRISMICWKTQARMIRPLISACVS
jgi:hypothetical protein